MRNPRRDRGETSKAKHRVFVSYSWGDAEPYYIRRFVEDILRALDTNEREYSCLEQELVDGVRRSEHLLSFLSPRYWDSVWCRFEWGVARGCDIPVFPLVCTGESERFPPHGFFQYYDVRPFMNDYPRNFPPDSSDE